MVIELSFKTGRHIYYLNTEKHYCGVSWTLYRKSATTDNYFPKSVLEIIYIINHEML